MLQIAMRFFQLVENDDAPRIFQHRPRQRATDFITRTSRRRTDQRENIVAMFVLIHPQNDRLRFRVERFGDKLAEKSFAGPGRANQKKSAERSAGRGEGKIGLQFGQDGIDRLILAAHIFLQPRRVGSEIGRGQLRIIERLGLRLFRAHLLPGQPAHSGESGDEKKRRKNVTGFVQSENRARNGDREHHEQIRIFQYLLVTFPLHDLDDAARLWIHRAITSRSALSPAAIGRVVTTPPLTDCTQQLTTPFGPACSTVK